MTIELVGIGAAPGDNTGDGLRTGMGKVNNNFSNSSHAASYLVGTATGQVPTADDLGVVGETNYSSGTLNTNTFGGSSGGRKEGIVNSSSSALFEIQTPFFSEASSVTINNTFTVITPGGSVITGGASITPAMSLISSTGITYVFADGLSGVSIGDPVYLECDSNSSLITVNP